MANARLEVTRSQILGFRRRVGALDRRLPPGPDSMWQAAWAGLQDSVPRSALLSIHARVEKTKPSTWEDPVFVQVWGPRYTAYLIAKRDLEVFTLGRLPDNPSRRRLAEDLAGRLAALLEGRQMSYAEAGRALDVHPNQLRYAATTGTVLLHWDGASRPVIRSVAPPDSNPGEARLELARRYLHVFGPATPQGFVKWAGVRRTAAASTFDSLGPELTPVLTPIGDSWILSSDEEQIGTEGDPEDCTRLLPSGDPYFLLQDEDRELLVPHADRRSALWPPRVWPGALLVAGEIVGTWRRKDDQVSIQTWRRLSAWERDAVEAEAASFPLPGVSEEIETLWQ